MAERLVLCVAQRRSRLLMAERLVYEWERADKVVEMINDDVSASTEEIITVVNSAPSLENVKATLQQECCTCFDVFPPSEVKATERRAADRSAKYV